MNQPGHFSGREWFLVTEKHVSHDVARRVVLEFDALYENNSPGLVDQTWERFLADTQEKYDREVFRQGLFAISHAVLAVVCGVWVIGLLWNTPFVPGLLKFLIAVISGSIMSVVILSFVGKIFWNDPWISFKKPEFIT